ncbi:hypothetical protein H8E07_07255, partial [bacterium]|nr:hypothetical protein [bacterium]
WVSAGPGSRAATRVAGGPPPGRHAAVGRGRDERGTRVASGLYFYRVQTPRYEETRRMMLVK